MHRSKIALLLVGISCLAIWYWLTPPPSPTRGLPPVSFVAYHIDGGAPVGTPVAQAALSWSEVTATTYNPDSELLAVAHTADISESVLRQRISGLANQPVQRVEFPAPDGPKCPVPHQLFGSIAYYFLWLGLASLFGSLWLLLRKLKFSQTRFSN